MQDAREQGDRIGMLLDLDQGSMTVWKNDEKLGVMQAEGLSGPYCWAADRYDGDSARIEYLRHRQRRNQQRRKCGGMRMIREQII